MSHHNTSIENGDTASGTASKGVNLAARRGQETVASSTAPTKLTAPSFASIVSSKIPTLASARSPKSFSSIKQQQKQEHAQPLTLNQSSNHSGIDETSTDISSNTYVPNVRNSSGSLSLKFSPVLHPSAVGAISGGFSQIDHAQNTTVTFSQTDNATVENDHEAETEEGDSSDIEILLGTQNMQDSGTPMHVPLGTGKGSPSSRSSGSRSSNSHKATSEFLHVNLDSNGQQHQSSVAKSTISSTVFGLRATDSNSDSNSSAKTLSPLPLAMPLSSSPSQNTVSQNGYHNHHQQYATTESTQTKSPHNPPSAPVHSTIPLPEMEYDQARDPSGAHQLEQLHQKICGDSSDAYGASIDLSSLSISGDNRSQPQQQQQQHAFGISASQTLPAISTTLNSISPRGSSPQSGFPTSASESALGSAGQKTPNVYINGLPPHFPEDQLFALASPYGEIRSVRTFTRHVRDSESGYGFVLFEDIDSAERCILSLRRYRNLHPTFSKQIHKIPGTTYADTPSQSSSWEGESSGSPGDVGRATLNGELNPEASFKAKMESLQDPTSTNLYMEGLPLSIDEPTLSALVSPHRISSSRFFQTRLSNPPRIIAFVRLETREGAEEIIERLHGRMVRGWNDTGSRISVRFADTSEQRELRRQERATQEGDISPGRLTIAQAALLNLRGQELKPTTNTGPVIHAHANGVGRLPTSVSAPDFSSNLAHLPVIGTTGGGAGMNLDVDYSLAPGRGGISSSRSRSPYHAPYLQYSPYGAGNQGLPSTDPTMNALLDSLRANGTPYQSTSLAGYADHLGEMEYIQNQTLGFGHGIGQLQASQSLGDLHQYARAPPVYTRSGYTPTEEYIMRAHAETAAANQVQQPASERRRPAPLDLRRRRTEEDLRDDAAANIAVGVRGYRAQASLGRIGQSLISPSLTSPMSTSPMMGIGGMSSAIGEDDFHVPASTSRIRNQRSFTNDEAGVIDRAVGSSAHARHNPNIHPAHVNARLSREPSATASQYRVQRPPMPLSPSLTSPATNQESTDSNDVMNYQHIAAHMRSTTLPQHRSSSIRDGNQQLARGHYQHNSMSMPAQNLRTPQHASVATLAGTRGIDGTSGNAGPGTNGTIYESDGQEQQQQTNDSGNSNSNGHSHLTQSNASRSQRYSNSPLFSDNMENTTSSPSLISPTLTYSSQTPSTMSPATPFFGTFNSQSEGFEKTGVDHHQQHGNGRKMISTSMNPSSLRTLNSEGR